MPQTGVHMVGNKRIQPGSCPRPLAYLQDLADTGAYRVHPTECGHDVYRGRASEGLSAKKYRG